MKAEEMKRIIEENKAGTFHSAEWTKQLKTKKSCSDIIEKRTIAKAIRLGVDYSHMQRTKEDNGVDPETGNANVQELKWGKWKQFPYLIEHKGREYLRMSLSENTKFDSVYLRNGEETTFEDIQNDCLKSNFSNSKPDKVITVTVDNINYIK